RSRRLKILTPDVINGRVLRQLQRSTDVRVEPNGRQPWTLIVIDTSGARRQHVERSKTIPTHVQAGRYYTLHAGRAAKAAGSRPGRRRGGRSLPACPSTGAGVDHDGRDRQLIAIAIEGYPRRAASDR